MDKTLIAKTLKTVKENSPKKNFKQSIDLVINLKGIDLKKTEQQINIFTTLHHDAGKKISVCAFVDSDLEKNAKEACDEVILADQFVKFKDKKEIKKLGNKHDYFVSQANIMSKVATVFGRVLGPKGKMPNPKLGGVLPPNANVKQLYEKLKKTVNLATKNEPTIKCMVGKEDSSEEEVVDNILTIYNSVIQKLPNEAQGIKSVILKLTMGPSFRVGEEPQKETAKAKPDTKKKETTAEPKKQPSKSEAKETAEKNQSKPKELKKEKPEQK
jgi:large subunit ribosomal protein L1|tara:strand:+ start:933 stop:1745 length:813 start_codon:yes stop_codon:yes gene_type:complete